MPLDPFHGMLAPFDRLVECRPGGGQLERIALERAGQCECQQLMQIEGFLGAQQLADQLFGVAGSIHRLHWIDRPIGKRK